MDQEIAKRFLKNGLNPELFGEHTVDSLFGLKIVRTSYKLHPKERYEASIKKLLKENGDLQVRIDNITEQIANFDECTEPDCGYDDCRCIETMECCKDSWSNNIKYNLESINVLQQILTALSSTTT
jgi:hypothetical protein